MTTLRVTRSTSALAIGGAAVLLAGCSATPPPVFPYSVSVAPASVYDYAPRPQYVAPVLPDDPAPVDDPAPARPVYVRRPVPASPPPVIPPQRAAPVPVALPSPAYLGTADECAGWWRLSVLWCGS